MGIFHLFTMRIRTSALAIALISISCGTSAKSPGPGWLTKSEILRNVQEQGYGRVMYIEATRKYWKVTVDKYGKFYVINFDPFKGTMVENYRSHDPDNEDSDEVDEALTHCSSNTGVKCTQKRQQPYTFHLSDEKR